jgi:hypothetical protein
LGHSLSAEETLLALGRQLNQTYQQVATNLSSNPLARVEKVDGKDELVLTSPDKLEEPPSLARLRNEIAARLPRVDLPEILLEIAARTDFTAKFTHISERDSRAGDLAVSICAVLLAEACNIGMEPLVRNDVPALRRSRLSWVTQNFVRNETITEANASLVAAQNNILSCTHGVVAKLLPLMAFGSSSLSGLSTQAQIQSISAMSAALLITTSFRISSPV